MPSVFSLVFLADIVLGILELLRFDDKKCLGQITLTNEGKTDIIIVSSTLTLMYIMVMVSRRHFTQLIG